MQRCAAAAAAGMLHGRPGMEATEERRHGAFTGVQREYPDSSGGDTAGQQPAQPQQHYEQQQQGEERRQERKHRLIQ